MGSTALINLTTFIANTPSADGLAPLGARSFVDTTATVVGIRMCYGL